MKIIIVVADSEMMRIWIRDILQTDSELKVIAEAKDGYEAIELCRKHHPDTVILDLVMRDMDGITALKEILQINPNIEVIVCTSLATDFNKTEALQFGAKDIVVKPYFNDLINKVKN